MQDGLSQWVSMACRKKHVCERVSIFSFKITALHHRNTSRNDVSPCGVYRSNALVGRRDGDQPDRQSCSFVDPPYFESSFTMDKTSTLTIRDLCTETVHSCSALPKLALS